ncbi:MAG: hypothetical protein H6998_08660 [Hahellaceae bacterium]|nr:hypothetical protein [Hahellaceae bacterium]
MKRNSATPGNPCERSPFLHLTGYTCLVFLTLASFSHAVQPLTESDMSDISLESATLERLLGIDGSTAAGEDDYITLEEPTRDMETSVAAAQSDSDRLHRAENESDGRQPVVQGNNPKAEDHNTVVTTSSKTSHGETLVILEPKLRTHDSTSNNSGNLNLQGNASIQFVQVQNARDSSNAIRGSYYMSNIQTQSNTSINSR